MSASYEQAELLYEGKGKKIFAVKGREDLVWMQFKDDLTAFNAEKKGSFSGKGRLNCEIASLIFRHLNQFQIPNHFVETVSDVDMIAKKVEIIPLEVIVRNWLAGSTAKKFQKQEGEKLETPLQEFFYKDDALGDPFINDEQALYLKAAQSLDELRQLKLMAREINGYLCKLFDQAGLKLVDFKIEFGRDPLGGSCWPMRSLRIHVGFGIKRLMKSLTKIGFAEIWAKSMRPMPACLKD
jgi:phosphoribosylaminoimidazole-succinocarboxamide synthase